MATVTMKDLILRIASEGGCIVSSADCHQIEIANAQARGDFTVFSDGLGYVRRLPEWLQKNCEYARGSTKAQPSRVANDRKGE